MRLAARAHLSLACLLLLTAPAAASEIKTFKLATGEVLVHAFKDGIPLPSDSKWAVCTGAGPSFVPEGKGESKRYKVDWNIFLKARGSPASLRDVARVTLEEVSGKSAIAFYDGPLPQANGDIHIVTAPGKFVSRDDYPWLYSPESTLFVFRVMLFKGKEQDKLFQPVLIGASAKRQIKDAGVLP
jgi:hypothetical protein